MLVDTEFRNEFYDIEGTISCEILHPVYGWIPFTANRNDPEPHGRLIYEHIKSNSRDLAADGTKLDGIEALADGTDTTNVTSADAPMDRAELADYRQALRDLTKQEDFPDQVVWPVPPA